MNKLKQIIQDRIVSPADHIRGSITTIGQVMKSDEINNMCSIKYVDKDGNKRNKDNVTVRLYGNGGDWFPAMDDFVVIEDTGSTVAIVARHVDNYNMDVRSKLRLTKDIHSDSFGGAIGGQIF
ncbi:hypothetical protein [Anaerospora hongkongensis]|uniref:hypothetical protein n=1 Tax=Anaerospora hongkongensis TaxID=244830 RepID=UPI0028A2A6EF|nr:hypothetical protein [Anaerospora hongkongensis]